jgi:outer membrane receptor protein involved in Fe transport
MGAGLKFRGSQRRWRSQAAAAALWLATAAVLALTPGNSLAQDQTVRFDVPAQPLTSGVLTLARQARLSILVDQDLVAGRMAPAVRGDMPARQALRLLLAGTGLNAELTSSGAVRLMMARANGEDGVVTVVDAHGRVVSAPYPEPAFTVDPLVVTGTSIQGRKSSALPVAAVEANSPLAQAALTPIEILSGLPQIGALALGESVSGSLGARGDNAAINLRGIGSNATLVLLNGRRLAPHPISATENGAPSFSVNVNQLPTRGLERIDVLRDGASSLYGSDAVAGVVNFITARRMQGTEVRGRVGYPEEGGGRSWMVNLTHGQELAGGRARVMGTLDLVVRDKIFLNQRDFSATADHSGRAPAPFDMAGSVFDGRPGNLFPAFRIGVSQNLTYFRPLAGGAFGFTSAAPSRTADPGAFVDVNRYQEIQPRSRRANGFASAEYDLPIGATLFGEASLYRAQSQLIRNPVPFNAPNADQAQVISADNPYNPYGSRFYSPTGAANADGSARLVGTPQALTLQSVLLVDGGADVIDVDSSVGRVVTGLRGRAGRSWSWETGLLYSAARTVDETQIGFRESLLGQALARGDAAAFNPFGYTFKVANGMVVADRPYRNPQAVLDAVMQPQTRTGESSIASIDFRASGEVIALPAGAASLGVGGELRRETFSDDRPAYFGLNPVESGLDPYNNDFVQASPKPNSQGDRTIGSVYAELVLPLVSPEMGVPLVRTLELGASLRHERYSDFGATTNPKFSLSWRPLTHVLTRASYNRGFSAPNLPTLYFPFQYTVIPAPGSIDAYRNPVTAEGPYVMRNYIGALRDLEPASSTGRSFGIVIDAPSDRYGRLTASADYWEISQTNVIASLTASQVLDRDDALLRAYVQAQLAAGVAIDRIDLGSGTDRYQGDPGVVRNPVTEADRALFAAYNATHASAPLAAVGTVLSRQTLYQNLSEGFVSGWDYSLDYASPDLAIGRLRLILDWAVLLKSYTVSPITGGAPTTVQQRLNVDGATSSRASATLAWRRRAWSASLSASYIGGYSDSAATTSLSVYEALGRPSYLEPVLDNGAMSYRYRVDDSLSVNLSGAYDFAGATTVRLGVVNLTNVEPPLASGNFGYTTSVYSSLAVGRTWTLELIHRF